MPPSAAPQSTRLARALAIVFANEGGVSTDRKDTAGDGSGRPHTNFGVTLKAVQALDADKALPKYLRDAFDVDRDGDIDFDDVPGWSQESAAEFYRLYYWNPIQAERMPFAIALVVFDAAVNMGTSAAVKDLQRALELKAIDGVVGRQTLAAACMEVGNATFLGELLAQRINSNRLFRTADAHFLGWARRCFSLHLEALKET